MYAVIVSGGKQHRVEEGEVLKLEKLEVATGESVELEDSFEVRVNVIDSYSLLLSHVKNFKCFDKMADPR